MIPFVNLANPLPTTPGTGLTEGQEAALTTATRRQPVASIAALKALTPSAGDAVNTLGYYAAGDGGGGTFYYDAAAADADNGGTIIAPTAGGGRWLRAYSGAVNVKWFGAKGDAVYNTGNNRVSGGTSDSAAFAAAFAASKSLYVPPGVYRLTETLWNKGSLVGESSKDTFLFFDAIAGDGIKFSDGVWGVGATVDYQVLKNFTIKGSLTGDYRVAVRVENTRSSIVDNIILHMNNVTPACWVGFGFSDCWGCTFSNLSTWGTAFGTDGIGFLLGKSYNANNASNWYTSNLNFQASIADDVDLRVFPAASGHGNNFDMMTLQGGRYGIWLRGTIRGCQWNSLYTENVVTPISLGKSGAGANVSYNHTFVGGDIGGPLPTHPRYSERIACIHLEYARHCQFINLYFDAVYGTPPTLWACWMNSVINCRFDGCKTKLGLSSLTETIVRSVGGGGGNKIMITGDYKDAYQALSLVMPVDDAWVNHRIMTVGNDGAWKSVQWAPVATDSAPA